MNETYDVTGELFSQDLFKLISQDLFETAWNQATLPVKSGGIGIRLATDIALPAFLSSMASSSPLILKLLPPRFQSSSGINEHLFLDAVSEWQTRSGQRSTPATHQ